MIVTRLIRETGQVEETGCVQTSITVGGWIEIRNREREGKKGGPSPWELAGL